MNYEEFIESKAFTSPPTGLEEVPSLNPKLFEHQRLLTTWALKRGRAAIFADTGLGKGPMILEWARVVAQETNAPTLILAPLAVAQQFEREAEKFGISVTLCESADDVTEGVNVTNYQKLHKFDCSVFSGVALDESSILKHLDGATRKLLIESFKETRFKLSATATPSPNDFTELGGQAEFLGVMKHAEMLASFFVRDGGSTQDWYLKGHAKDVFWKWVASWGAMLKLPSDLGCADDGYILPPLVHHEHVVPATLEDARASGKLFADVAKTMNDQRAARRGTLETRVSIAAELASKAEGQVIVWCDLNSESEALRKAIPDSIEITGSQDDDEKVANLLKFISGEARVLVSKPSLCGFGINLQFARTVVFCGVTHSFEAWYQAIRRSWRFGVEGQVDCHIVTSELEGAVLENLKRKAKEAEELSDETRKYVSDHVREAVIGLTRTTIEYKPELEVSWPSWLITEAA